MEIMIEEIKLLLDLFESKVHDKESNRLAWWYCDNQNKWIKAHDLFTILRDKNLAAIEQGDEIKESQYYFEEVIAETLFNLTMPDTPFDPDTPYWVIKNALSLAHVLDIPTEKVVEIVT